MELASGETSLPSLQTAAFSLPFHLLSSMNTWKERARSLIRTPVLTDQGPTLMPSFNLITSLKVLSPHILGVRASTYKF